MFPIFLENTSKPIVDFDNFKNYFINICNSHKNQNRALAFCFILYDFNNHNIRRILSDKIYWDTLDSISGMFFTIFSFNYREKIRPKKMDRSSDSGFMHFMTSFNSTKDSTQISEFNDNILKHYFTNSKYIKFPVLIFFQVQDDAIIDSFLVSLKEEKTEESFFEMRDYIKKAADTLQMIQPDYFENNKEIFDQLKLRINDTKHFKFANSVKNRIKTVTDLFLFLGKFT